MTLLTDVKILRKQRRRSVMQVNLFWGLLLGRQLVLIFNQRQITAFVLPLTSVSLHTFYTNSDYGASGLLKINLSVKVPGENDARGHAADI